MPERREPVDERSAPGAAADHDHVVVAHTSTPNSLRRSLRMIRAAASIRARCEKAWGKFPRWRPGARVELLGVEAERRGDAKQPVHQVPRALVLADDRQARDQPEGADQEAALLAGEAVVGLAGDVAEHEAVLGQVVGDRQHALAQHLVVARQEAEHGGQQRGGVEGIGVVVLAQDAVRGHRSRGCPCGSRRRWPATRPGARSRRGSPRASRRGPGRPSTSASRRRIAGACRAPPRSPGPASSRRFVAHFGLGLHDRPEPARQALAAMACGAGSSRGRRRRRRSGAGRRRRCRLAPVMLPRNRRGHPGSSRSGPGGRRSRT